MFPLPSVSLSLCLCFGGVTCCRRERRRDGQSQWSAAKSRLWLMNRAALPSYWAEFTSSHNHSFSSTSVSLRRLRIYLPLSPSFCSSVFLFLVICYIVVCSSCSNLSLGTCFASVTHASHIFLLSLFLLLRLLFIPHAVNLPPFAASGTRRTTRSPGTSSTQPTSISLWPSTPTTRA